MKLERNVEDIHYRNSVRLIKTLFLYCPIHEEKGYMMNLYPDRILITCECGCLWKIDFAVSELTTEEITAELEIHGINTDRLLKRMDDLISKFKNNHNTGIELTSDKPCK